MQIRDMRNWLLITLGLGLLLRGGSKTAKNLIVKVKDWHFAGVDITNGRVALYLNLMIKNPLVVGVQIKGVTGDVYVQGNKCGYVNMAYDYNLAGGKTHIIPVVVNLLMGDVAQSALLNIQTGDIHNLTVAFDGNVHVGKYAVGVPIKFELDYNDLTE